MPMVQYIKTFMDTKEWNVQIPKYKIGYYNEKYKVIKEVTIDAYCVWREKLKHPRTETYEQDKFIFLDFKAYQIF